MRDSVTGLDDRDTVPIVVVVYHREEDTSRMFRQLASVTDGYRLIVVNNGYDDPGYLRNLADLVYLENKDNVGAIRGINQGLTAVDDEYICVLHNDVLIYDDGWLDHIIDFMERRQDVGLVGLVGRHSINEDGTLDYESTVVDMARYDESFRPTWRFTEVATIDGLGWVMRNLGFSLDEGYGLMHYYDIDLSMQYLAAGYLVYTAAVELDHLAEDKGRSTRDETSYLNAIGGDDMAYFERARERFKSKWGHMLPVSRGYRDEAYGYKRITEVREQYQELEHYVHKLEESDNARGRELEEAAAYARTIEKELELKHSDLLATIEHVDELQCELEKAMVESTCLKEELTAARIKVAPPGGAVRRLLFFLGREGFRSTAKRIVRRLHGKQADPDRSRQDP